jgi:hypothetical protein
MTVTRAQIKSKMIQINKLACKFMQESGLFDRMCSEYYGEETYSDHDKDWIIDCLDYGNGEITFEDFDKIMKEINTPPEE